MKKRNGRLLERTLARDISREELERISGAKAASDDTWEDTWSGDPLAIDD